MNAQRISLVFFFMIAGLTSFAVQDDSDQAKRFQEAKALYANGESQKGDEVISELAPDDKPGYDVAHLFRARTLAEKVAKTSSEESLAKLRWHLEHSPKAQSGDVDKLWAAYFVTIEQPHQAVPYLERATMSDPHLHLALANLYAEIGSKPSEARALRQAETHLRRLLAANPLSITDRFQLTVTLVRLNRSDEAEKLMLEGVKLHNNDEVRRAAAQYYLLQSDINQKESPNDFESRITFARKRNGIRNRHSGSVRKTGRTVRQDRQAGRGKEASRKSRIAAKVNEFETRRNH